MSESRMSYESALGVLARRRTNQVVVSTMTAITPWRDTAKTDRDLVCGGFMGGSSALGLGVALARPDVPVWIIDGDGSLVMQLGSLVTVANAAPRRFLHVVMHNGVYDTSGAQPLPAEGIMSFAALASAAGYVKAVRFEDAETFDASIDELLDVDGPVLVELMTQPRNAFMGRQAPPQTRTKPALAQGWPGVRDSLKASPA